ncbi:MAG TPA: response regulator [Deltaproteobacteria bacterium]|nr:response regulator [Deltaproteobacteria bacterium]
MKRLMLVDDSRVMRQLVRRSVRQAGFKPAEVVEAENGVDALQQLQRFRPSLILSDWNMPEMGGLELLETLRSDGNQVPLGFVTSEGTPAMRAAAMSKGAIFLLTKPFTASDVRYVLENAGFRADGNLRGPAKRTHIGHKPFGPDLLKELLDHLVGQQTMIRPCPRLPPSVRPAISMSWIDDDDNLLYGGLCELQLGAAMGAALSMRPPSAVGQLIASGQIAAELQPDCREVFNVMSRSFTDAGSVRVRLADISFAPEPPVEAVVQLNRRAPARRDFKIAIGRHGAGRLAILSTHSGFLRYT